MNIRMLMGVVFLFAIVAPCTAQDEELFLQAHQLYEHRDYQKAHDAYNAINNKGFRVWYNMGNCAYQDNKFAQARVYWEQARIGAPVMVLQAINHNISVIDKKLSNGVLQAPAWFTPYIQAASPLLLQAFFLISWFGLFFFVRRLRLWHGVCLFFLLLNIGLGMLLGIKYSMTMNRKGIVMQHDVALYSGPDKNYHVVAITREAAELVIKESNASWHKVSYNNVSGWISADQVTVV